MNRAPYKYLEYYTFEDADLFFGREEETQKMVGEILSTKLLVLFSPSGSGKTSLINAGVRPELEKLGYKTVYVRLEDDPIPSVRNAVAQAFNLDAAGQNTDLHGFLQEATRQIEKSLVIFIDQFEEFFIIFSNEKLRHEFIQQVAKIKFDDKLPVFLVLSLREDYFANLHEFREAIPSIFQNNANIHLEPFTEAEARRAITEPVKTFGIEFQKDLVDTLVQDLKNGKAGIEPIKLQIVCHTLWQQKPATATQLTVAHYQASGETEAILRDHVSHLLKKVPRRQHSLMVKIFEALKTPDNTKRYRSMSDLQETLGLKRDRLETVLQYLTTLNLLRHEERTDDDWYEFKHDYLVSEIASWLRARQERLAQRRLLYGLSPGVALLLGLLAYLFIQYNSFYAGLVSPKNVASEEDEIAVFRSNPFYQVVATTGFRLSEARDDSTRRAFKNHFKIGFWKSEDWRWLGGKLSLDIGGKLLFYLDEIQVALDTLLAALKDQNPDVRSQAAAALTDLGKSDDRVISALLAALKDQDPYVRDQAAVALVNLGKSDDRVISALLAALKDPNTNRYETAAAALVNLGKSHDRVISTLLAALKDQNYHRYRNAIATLVNLGRSDDRVISALVAALNYRPSSDRIQAATALVSLGKSDDRVISTLVAELGDQYPNVRSEAAAALVNLGKSDDRVISALIAALKDQNLGDAAAALGNLGKSDDRVISALLAALKDQSSFVREQAATVLINLGKSDDRVISALIATLKDVDEDVRRQAAQALGALLNLKPEYELFKWLTNPLSGYRTASAQALARQDSLPLVLQNQINRLRKDGRPWVRLAAWEAHELIQERFESEKKAMQLLHKADSLFASNQLSVASYHYGTAFYILIDVIRVDSAKTAYATFQQARCKAKLKRNVAALNDLELAFQYQKSLRDTLQAEMAKPENDWKILEGNWYLREVLLKR
ncbi:HEAT repeat domain-containing protein [candidate division KSB1 bacterium]|nr:HEAT repeat domain-containing protein [candidate division KSB1 bacterium]